MKVTPCDLAIAREHDALQALADRQSGDPTASVNASFTLTGRPTLAELEAEVEAAANEVETVCRGGPTR